MKNQIEKTKNAIPDNRSKREKYIGLRENLNEPSFTIWVVGFKVSNGVLFLIRIIKEFPAIQMDTSKIVPPTIVRGNNVKVPRPIGKRYSKAEATPIHIKKYRGGGIRIAGPSFLILSMDPPI